MSQEMLKKKKKKEKRNKLMKYFKYKKKLDFVSYILWKQF